MATAQDIKVNNPNNIKQQGLGNWTFDIPGFGKFIPAHRRYYTAVRVAQSIAFLYHAKEITLIEKSN